MSSPAATQTKPQERRQGTKAPVSRKTKIAIGAGALLLGLGFLLWNTIGPFARGPIMQHLAEASGRTVTSRSFHRTYFPFPGCVVEDLIFRHGSANNPPLITIEKLTIRAPAAGTGWRRGRQFTPDQLTAACDRRRASSKCSSFLEGASVWGSPPASRNIWRAPPRNR